MKHQLFQISSKDGKTINGHLTLHDDSDTVVVFCHGLLHTYLSFLPTYGASWFPQQGVSFLRFGFYDISPESRNLEEITLRSMTEDIDAVANHLNGQFENIILVGHSTAAVSLALSAGGCGADHVVLLDPAFNAYQWWESQALLGPRSNNGVRTLDYGITFLVGDDLIEDMKMIDSEAVYRSLENCSAPVSVILAGNSPFREYSQELLSRCTLGITVHTVADADHTFSDVHIADQVFKRIEQSLSRQKIAL